METAPTQTSDSAHFEANDKASDGSGALPPNGVAPGNKHSREEAMEALPSKFLKSDGMERPAATNGESPDVVAMDNWDAPSVTTATTVVMEWHSCSICLEEMVDSELVSHGECGGVVCPGCLQSSVEHYCSKETGLMPCPLCARHVRPGEAFTPLATTSSDDTVIRYTHAHQPATLTTLYIQCTVLHYPLVTCLQWCEAYAALLCSQVAADDGAVSQSGPSRPAISLWPPSRPQSP